MGWLEPAHSREAFDTAGEVLRRDDSTAWFAYAHALPVVNNWRSSHAFPLNTFQVGLRLKAREIDQNALIAQRIKRLPTIERKLKHRDDLKLTDIQDIGGCRAIMSDVRGVLSLVDRYKKSSIKHKIEHEDDYIARPRRSGYRSIHLIYRYYSDRKTTYNGMKVEIQVRSSLQHAWATAVETVGLFTGQFLKNQQGDKDWLKFFALMGSAIAIKEDCATVDRTPKDPRRLYETIREYEKRLNVIERLTAYGNALQVMNPAVQGAEFFLLQLDPATRSLQITAYRPGQIEAASVAYLAAEQGNAEQPRDPERDAVLVRVESALALQRAYPNYFPIPTTSWIRVRSSARLGTLSTVRAGFRAWPSRARVSTAARPIRTSKPLEAPMRTAQRAKEPAWEAPSVPFGHALGVAGRVVLV